jgi:peptidoglycan/LPS O-acetylase OafA/YrhL
MKTMPNRILFLDGLRGLAILLVIFYKAFAGHWNSFLPYHDAYSQITIFKFGNYGVQLFFMISGFVIAMTLEKCERFSDFMFRRWIRLFPAMLIVTLAIFATAAVLSARPYGAPRVIDAIAGLFFIEPDFFKLLFGQKFGMLEGSFWTLFVEMKFYVLAGLLYFTVGSKKMIAVLVAMFLVYMTFDFFKPQLPNQLAEQLDTILHYLNYQHYGWFAAGALFYQYSVTKQWLYWFAGLLVALLSARLLGGLQTISMLFATVLLSIFAFSMTNASIQKLLSNKLLVFFGFISYPLYLLHEQAMFSLIMQLYPQLKWLPGYFLPVLPLLIVVFAAWIVANYLEPYTRKVIRNLFSTMRLSASK